MAKVSSLLHERLRHSSLCVTDDAQLMTESVIDDALLHAMPHIKHTLIQFFGIMKFMKFCLVYSLPYF